MAQITYPFQVPAEYNFDALKAEINNGGKLLNQGLSNNISFAASYASNINGSWGDGVLTGTAVGGASVVGGYLDLTGGTKYVDYAGLGNADSTVIAFRFIFQPNYSSAPATSQKWITVAESAGSLNNMISFGHNSGAGAIQIVVYDSIGIVILNANTSTGWLPTAGQEYEVYGQIDTTNGDIRIWIEGTQFTGTYTATGTRTTNVGLLRVGAYYNGSSPTDGKIKNLTIYASKKHSSNYTAPIAFIPSRFDTSDPIITPVSPIINGTNITNFVENVTKSGSDDVKYSILEDGVRKYWNGSAWVAADGTFAQTNTEAEINTNGASLNAANTLAVDSHLRAGSTGENTTPIVNSLIVDFTFNPPAIVITTINVYGYLHLPKGAPVDITRKVRIRPIIRGTHTDINTKIPEVEDDQVVNANGGWAADLIPSADLGGIDYEFTFMYGTDYEWTEIRTVVGNGQVKYEDLV